MQILDQSVLVVRTADMGVVAFHSACAKRNGVRVAEGRGSCERVHVPVPRLVLRPRRREHVRLAGSHLLGRTAWSQPPTSNLSPVRCETWGGCAWIARSRPLRRCASASNRSPPRSAPGRWKNQGQWWRAIHLPVNWKLAEEAFVEQYHVIETHPQLVIPDPDGPRPGGVRHRDSSTPAALPPRDERRDGRDGPCRRRGRGRAARHRAVRRPRHRHRRGAHLNSAVVPLGTTASGHDIPDLNELEASGLNEPMGYCFPHYFVLPMYGNVRRTGSARSGRRRR
ncbi:MAG: SRPBCC family protein [Acidimicrobiales bacterium]